MSAVQHSFFTGRNPEASFLASILAKLSTAVSSSTASSYIRFVKNLKTKVDGGPLTSFVWLKDVAKVVSTVVAHYAASTATSIYNAIQMVLRTGTKPFKALADKYQAKMKEGMGLRKEHEGEKTEKQEDYDLPWEEVVKKRDELKGVDKVILSLYTMLPPGRAMEFATMTVGGDGLNRYEDGKFIIGKQKTSKEIGTVVVDVPKNLQEVLDDWLDGRTTGLLLGGLTAPSITKHLNAIFKPKKIGVSALRHLYLAKYAPVKKEMMADAKAMRHSIGTALGTYVKA